jgi:hypothetical protein
MQYKWSPLNNAKELNLHFKVWFDIINAPPHFWSLDEIIKAVGSFGVLLDHAPLHHVKSFEKLRVLVACRSLRVPHSVTFALDGVETKCPIAICSWASEPTVFKVPTETLPSNEYSIAQEMYMKEKKLLDHGQHNITSSQDPTSSPKISFHEVPREDGKIYVDRDVLQEMFEQAESPEYKRKLKEILDSSTLEHQNKKTTSSIGDPSLLASSKLQLMETKGKKHKHRGLGRVRKLWGKF